VSRRLVHSPRWKSGSNTTNLITLPASPALFNRGGGWGQMAAIRHETRLPAGWPNRPKRGTRKGMPCRPPTTSGLVFAVQCGFQRHPHANDRRNARQHGRAWGRICPLFRRLGLDTPLPHMSAQPGYGFYARCCIHFEIELYTKKHVCASGRAHLHEPSAHGSSILVLLVPASTALGCLHAHGNFANAAATSRAQK